MKIHSIFLAGVALLVVALSPARTLAQQASSDEAQQLRQVVEQLQAQMRQIVKVKLAQAKRLRLPLRRRLLLHNRRPQFKPRKLRLQAPPPDKSETRRPVAKSSPKTRLRLRGLITFLWIRNTADFFSCLERKPS